MITVFIEPCDIVYFRDDLPFGARGNQIARCQFPPRPSVIAGALRTKILASHGVDFDAFRDGKGIPDAIRREVGAGMGREAGFSAGSFSVRRISIGNRGENGIEVSYFRPGRDLVARKKKLTGSPSDESPRIITPAVNGRVPGRSSLGSEVIQVGIEPQMEPRGGWLDSASYISYLAGRERQIRVTWERDILERDFRVGIGLDMAVRTVDEGRLFSSEGVVMKDGWGFVVGVDGCSLVPSSGIIRLGGDGRMARLSPWKSAEPDWSVVRQSVLESGRFRWVLQTPGIFEQGWLPKAVTVEDGRLLYSGNGFKARLVSAAVGPSELAGGWDLVRGGPKAFRRMVPAGSVFWFEIVEGKAEAAWESIHDRSVSDERANEGFGLVHLGGWDYV